MPASAKRLQSKVDNDPAAYKAKVDVRRKVLETIGADANVFDAFAGTGEMYSAVWKDARGYTGCDLVQHTDSRLMFAADNRRVLRAIDLDRFTIFDLDANGAPWNQAIIIADRRKVLAGELVGLVLTEGGALAYRSNTFPAEIAELTGLRSGIVGLANKQGQVLDKAIAGLARRMSCTIVKRWQADGRTKSSTRYIGLVLKGMG